MKILAIPDTHAPFAHPRALDFLAALRKGFRPDAVVHLGDLGDQHGWSRHGRLPDAPGQGDEDSATVEWCRAIYRLFPHVLACEGNHDTRLAAACSRAGIPSRLHRTIPEVYGSPPGWDWAESHTVDGIVFEHGEGYSGADAAVKAAINNGANTVIGHIHSVAGVRYSCFRSRCIFGASAGCLVDPRAVGLSYARKCVRKPVLGCLLIENRVPRFVPLEV